MTAFDHPYELPKRQARHFFAPSRTIRCTGVPKFRSQHARDVATLLDVDDEVVAWNATRDWFCSVPPTIAPTSLSSIPLAEHLFSQLPRTFATILTQRPTPSDWAINYWFNVLAIFRPYGYRMRRTLLRPPHSEFR